MFSRSSVAGAALAGTVVGILSGVMLVAAVPQSRPSEGRVVTLTATVPVTPTVEKSPAFVARYTFDSRIGTIIDDSGRGHTLRLLSAYGGTVRTVARGGGRAVAFPGKCPDRRCAHAVLQSRRSADLNPGTRPLSFGATVRLERNQTSSGQNVLQKGYAAKTSQYKLQIDGRAGRPSCVLVDRRRPAIQMAHSKVSVADGRWHTVECRRVRGRLTVLIDGTARGSRRIPTGLSISNRSPLSIGGKGAYRDNDQYLGALDDVWVRIG